MAFNIINPDGICQLWTCGKPCEKHMKYCCLRHRDRASHLRRRQKELGMESEGVVYEGQRIGESRNEVPPFPSCETEILAMVGETLAIGQAARFEGARDSRPLIPDGCEWTVIGDIGTLTKITTRSVE